MTGLEGRVAIATAAGSGIGRALDISEEAWERMLRFNLTTTFAFLASAEAGFVSGATLDVNGTMLMM